MTENITDTIRLTQYAKGAGCGCKVSSSVLKEMLKSNVTPELNPQLLVGNESSDDAAVFDLGNGSGLISTTDVFMPIVDDPFTFGRIAAVNAISDVYAMGGRPIMALAILGWPIEKLGAEIAAMVLEGGRSVCAEAGIPLAGGHTIDNQEPLFGLSVNGLVNTDAIKKNNTAREGDFIYLTKPLGTGIITTAAKRGLAKQEHLNAAIRLMTELNRAGEELGKIAGVNAMTDITGFGLLGHLLEMADGSDLTATINYSAIQLLDGLDEYLQKFIFPDMTTRNYSGFSDRVSSLTSDQLLVLCDPQTSGGLLVSVDPAAQTAVEELLKKHGCPVMLLGRFDSRKDKSIFVNE